MRPKLHVRFWSRAGVATLRLRQRGCGAPRPDLGETGAPTQPLVAGLRLNARAEGIARNQRVTISLMTEPFPEQTGTPHSAC
jgi:hypothetical protein